MSETKSGKLRGRSWIFWVIWLVVTLGLTFVSWVILPLVFSIFEISGGWANAASIAYFVFSFIVSGFVSAIFMFVGSIIYPIFIK